jgi:Domain of unknown function (DUF4412)
MDLGGLMKSIVKGMTCVAAMCVLTGTLQAASGVLIVSKTTSSGGAPDSRLEGALGDRTSRVQIAGTRMRSESTDTRGEKHVMVFDGQKQVLDIIDISKKTYTEMTKDDLEKVADTVAQMQKRMETMPPAQRAKMEAAMKARPIQYKKTGTGTVGKWTCDKYEGFDKGQKTSEVCTVDPKVLGFALTDLEVSRQLAEFFKKMMPTAGAQQVFTVGTVADQGFSGLPVRRTTTIAGREMTTEITEVSRQTFPDSIFAVPEGFQKQSPGGRPGRQ